MEEAAKADYVVITDEGKITEEGTPTQLKEKYIKEFKIKNISIYILHHPLDRFGEYSTCKTLADRLSIEIEKPAFLYFGAKCGPMILKKLTVLMFLAVLIILQKNTHLWKCVNISKSLDYYPNLLKMPLIYLTCERNVSVVHRT